MPLTARFGIEEEYVLLDARALVPLSATALKDGVLGEAPEGGRLTSEFLTSQLEGATEPVRTLEEARTQLLGMRRMLSQHAPAGSLIAATGAPFALAGAAQISASAHYDDVSELMGRLVVEHEVNGMHVHVDVADDEERVRALRRVREWLPVLLALSANSPFAKGMPAGLASWRSILIRRLPVSWCPPVFRDADDYHRTVDRLVGIGLLPARSSVSWAVRLSERYETVETRVADVQLRVDDALLLAALIRGIVCATGIADAEPRHEDVDAGLWLASRHGMGAHLFAPDGRGERAWESVDRMLASIRPVLEEFGDAEFVDEQLARLRAEGTGSVRQLRAHATGGVDALAELIRA